MDFTLEPSDAQWVSDTVTRATDELRQTAPGGRVFADAVAALLEREKNWVRWKNEMCPPFDREPRAPPLEQEIEPLRKKMREDPEPWPHALGSASLSEIWALGYKDMLDLENPSKYVMSIQPLHIAY